MSGYAYDPQSTPASRVPGVASAGAFGPNNRGGSMMTKTNVNRVAGHVAVAAVIVWAITKFV